MSIEKLQNELLEYAINIAKKRGIKLDYSNKSIMKVETILSSIHEEYMLDKNDEGLNGIALIYAFYIGSVINKNYGTGHFEQDHKEFGEYSYPFYLNEGVLFLHTWCTKRIFDGPEDNVWSKYSIFIIDKLQPLRKKCGFFGRFKKIKD